MSNPGEFRPAPIGYSAVTEHATSLPVQSAVGSADTRVPLLNLSTVSLRMDSLQRFLTESVNQNTVISKDQMDMVSSEITSAIHEIIVNGAALLACSGQPPVTAQTAEKPFDSVNLGVSTVNEKTIDHSRRLIVEKPSDIMKVEEVDEEMKEEIDEDRDGDCEIVEMDAVELLAEHIHFCEICGKGFKRDANLRMHMRAHGNQYKTPEALARPEKFEAQPSKTTMFSCPFQGCNRNKCHKKFKALKSVICVKNHFKRSHCPKMYSCNRCNKKNFSVLTDLKSHLKHCGEVKWRCSCGTSFSRKDKLFGHMALFEGHMPSVADEDDKLKGVAAMEEDEDDDRVVKGKELGSNCSDNEFVDGLFDGLGPFESYYLQDMLGLSPGYGL